MSVPKLLAFAGSLREASFNRKIVAVAAEGARAAGAEAAAARRVDRRRQFALIHERIADVPTLAFQSRDGWASQLLLLPHELVRVIGDRNGLILAPMRDLLICLPLDVEREFARTPVAPHDDT